MNSTITISPNKVVKILALSILVLTLANIAGLFSTYYLGHNRVYGLVPLFNLGLEANIPTWYASITLLISSILLWTIATAKKKEGDHYARHWKVLSFVFLFLSVDEAAGIHELLVSPLREVFHFNGIFFYSWVVPYALIVIIIGLAYTSFFVTLPPKTRWLFFVSAAIFMLGALGMELIGGWYVDTYLEGASFFLKTPPVELEVLVLIEEFLEMAGVLIFIYALSSYLQSNDEEVRIRFNN